MIRIPLTLEGGRLPGRWRKILIGLGIILLAYAALGFLALPAALRARLPALLGEPLGRKVTLRQVSVNPFALSARLEGFSVAERDGTGEFMGFDELSVNVGALSVFRGALLVEEATLVGPRVSVVFREDRTYNFSDLLETFAGKKEPARGTEPFRYSLNNIRVRGGAVSFDDRPKRTRHAVTAIDVDLPFLSNVSYHVDTYIEPSFAATVNGRPFRIRGRTKPFSESLRTDFDVNIDRFDIPFYWEYVPDAVPVRVFSGTFSTKGVLTFTQFRDRPPTVGFVGRLGLDGIGVRDRGGKDLLSFVRFDAYVSASDVPGRRFDFTKVVLEGPRLDVRRDAAGRVNLLALAPAGSGGGRESGTAEKRAGKKEGGAAGSPPPLRVTAKEFVLDNGAVRFEDFAARRPFRTTVAPVSLVVREFSNEPGKGFSASLSLGTEAGETVRAEGTASVDPPAVEGSLDVKGVILKKYAPYYEGGILFDVQDGRVDVATRFRLATGEKGLSAALSGLGVTVKALRLKKRDEAGPFLAVPALSVSDGSVDLGRKEVTVGRLETAGGTVALRRPKGGAWNVATLLPAVTPPGTPEASGASRGAPAPGGARKEGGAAGTVTGKGGPSWAVRTGTVSIGGYGVSLEDLAPPDPVTASVSKIAFRSEGLQTAGKAPGRVAFSAALGRGGTVNVRGTVRLSPPACELDVRLAGAEIPPFQPYVADRVRLVVTGGKANLSGRLSLSIPEGGKTQAAYRGEASVTDFASVDRDASEEFLKWTSLALSGIDLSVNPTRVTVAGVALADFYSRIHIDRDRKVNLQTVFARQGGDGEDVGGPSDEAEGEGGGPRGGATDDAATGSAAARLPGEGGGAADNAAPVPMRIDLVTLQGGTVHFTDLSVRPGVNFRVTELGGRITGLLSDQSRQGEVDLRGRGGAGSVLEVTGKINPLATDLFVDLKVAFKGIDLTSFSPYAGRYAGYAIEKGNLSLDLHYFIERKKLDSENRVVIDQFTFGEKVDSPDATKLPVKLAVSLLKDRNGVIDLDLPVTGRTDDPEFRIGRVVLKLIVNLLTKVATSPFALLGAAFGGGEEMSFVEFEAGRADFDAPSGKKLDDLAKALAERPALKLEISGYADRERDAEGLRRRAFERKVRGQKIREAAGKEGAAADNVAVSAAEYPVYLKKAYRAEKFPKPRNILGIPKDLPVPEMEKLLLAHIEVTDDELRALARERANNARERLIGGGAVAADRVFLVEANSLAPEKKEKVRDSRVDFRLR